MQEIKPTKDRLVINFSVLNLWSKGYCDQAIQAFYHTDKFDTEAMAEGRAFHETWAKEITKTKKLKVGNTTLLFKEPQCEHLIQTKYNDHFDIKGTIDCIDNPVLYEFKTGITTGLDFSGTMQIPMYFLINEMVGNHLEKAVLLHYNQHVNKTEYIVIWNDEEKMISVRNWVETLAPEIEDYWRQHNLSFDPNFYKKNT